MTISQKMNRLEPQASFQLPAIEIEEREVTPARASDDVVNDSN